MAPPPPSESAGDLGAKVGAQGDKVRQLKSDKADKAEIDAAVKLLLDLKVCILGILIKGS